MGIPLYFRKIVSQHHGLIIDTVPKCSRLFIDFNGIIHGAAARVLDSPEVSPTAEYHEERVIQETILYMNKIIQYTQPKELLYIGMDGVAPLAKIQQQRSRRHMTHFIKNSDSYVRPKFEWDTNAISPGTHFMNKCSTALCVHFRKLKPAFQWIVSDSLEEGEGEHKIFNFIEANPVDRSTDIIYGLDADLIMLGLISKQRSIYLLREPVHFKQQANSKPFLYFDVEKFRQVLDKRYDQGINIRSYVFLCFLIGNDFLPALSYLHIRNNDIEKLVQNYVSIQKENELIYYDEGRFIINSALLITLLGSLSENETSSYQKAHNNYFSQSTSNMKSKEQRLENYGICKKNMKLQGLFEHNWIQSYYVELFDMTVTPDNLIKDVCESYIRGLMWTSEYYFNKKNYFTWMYPYDYSPTIIDVYNTLQTNTELIRSVEQERKIQIDPEMQLLMILPVQSKRILPSHLQSLMDRSSKIGYMYPQSFELQTYLKTKLHECIPILPKLRIKDFLQVYEQTR
jgi:5'-3' exoribonuclease 1